jgi:hypothetical protein
MSILKRIIGRLREIVQAIGERIDERREARLADKLDELAADKPYKNWRSSSEDLAYLLGEDGSFEGRTDLWADLGFSGEYKGTAAQNVKLHARLLEEAAREGVSPMGLS